MTDPQSSRDKIEAKIAELEQERALVMDQAEAKAFSSSEYDKSYAITVLKLREHLITEWAEVPVRDLPVTLILSVAKGICYKEAYSRDLAEGIYKGLISNMDALKSELNGLQSINRYIE